MGARNPVQVDLTHVQVALARCLGVGEAFDGILVCARRSVDSAEDDTIATIAKNINKLNGTVVDNGADRRRRNGGRGRHHVSR